MHASIRAPPPALGNVLARGRGAVRGSSLSMAVYRKTNPYWGEIHNFGFFFFSLFIKKADLVAQRNSVAANVAGLIDARLLVISGLIEAAQK